MADLADVRTWGVGLDKVSSLAPHVSVWDAAEQGGNPPRDAEYQSPTRAVTAEDVRGWVLQVAARVTARLEVAGFDPANVGDAVRVLAHDATANGAAAYLVDAAFPARSSVNDSAAYGATLWARFREALGEIDALGRARADGGAAGGSLPASSAFPATAFPDVTPGGGARW